MRETFHLVPADVWAATDRTRRRMRRHRFGDEGFIHCTDGEAELRGDVRPALRDRSRSFVALTLDLDALRVPWRLRTIPARPSRMSMGRSARRGPRLADVERDPDGRFAGLTPR
jgi:hypothetical protein